MEKCSEERASTGAFHEGKPHPPSHGKKKSRRAKSAGLSAAGGHECFRGSKPANGKKQLDLFPTNLQGSGEKRWRNLISLSTKRKEEVGVRHGNRGILGGKGQIFSGRGGKPKTLGERGLAALFTHSGKRGLLSGATIRGRPSKGYLVSVAGTREKEALSTIQRRRGTEEKRSHERDTIEKSEEKGDVYNYIIVVDGRQKGSESESIYDHRGEPGQEIPKTGLAHATGRKGW